MLGKVEDIVLSKNRDSQEQDRFGTGVDVVMNLLPRTLCLGCCEILYESVGKALSHIIWRPVESSYNLFFMNAVV